MPYLDLPPEGTYSAIEHDFIENEPPGLFPTDQNSYWGQARKVFTDHLQALADRMSQWYLNLDPATVNVDDMPEWEYMLDIPDSTGKALEDRRAFIQSRFERGPFTKTRRRTLVERFIEATFGQPIIFDADGVPFDADGIPFLSGATSLIGVYSIKDNGPYGRNLIANGNFETDLGGWIAWSASVISQDVTRSKFGEASVESVSGSEGGVVFAITLDAFETYTYSAWVYSETGGDFHLVLTDGIDQGLVSATVTVAADTWTQLQATGTLDAHVDRDFRVVMEDAGTCWIDGVQIELGDTANLFVDTLVTPFYYEVRILDTIDPDLVGLARELDRITPDGIEFDIIETATP